MKQGLWWLVLCWFCFSAVELLAAWEMSLSLGESAGALGESTGLPMPIMGLHEC